ncbi:hypothetical protein R6Q57_028584 [Mikania cordata]
MNPRPNNPNLEFNPFSYDPESLKIYWFNYNKTRTSNTFNNIHQTSNHLQTFNPVLLSTPNLGSNLILCHQVNLITRSCRRHKTLKNAKRVRKTNSRPEQGRVVVQWRQNNGLAMKKSLSEDATWTNPRTKPKVKSNSQKYEIFWKKVAVTWHNVMGFDVEYRTYHQLNSKSNDMCTKLTKLSGIYSNCANNRKSEMSDLRAWSLCLSKCSTTKIVK